MRSQILVFGQPVLGEEEIREVVDCLRSRWIGSGPRVAKLEELLRGRLGVAQAVAVSSCTAALFLTLKAAGIGEGDEVVTTPMTFCATVNAILHADARPVLADVDPESMLLTPESAARAVTSRTRAVLPVHLAGHPTDVEGFSELAREKGVRLVFDAAHAVDTGWNGESVCRAGDASCLSFYATKNLVTAEGGMVVTPHAGWADRVRTLALHGLSTGAWSRFSEEKYRHYSVVEPGYKMNMTDLHASIGLAQLDRLESMWARRDEIWRRYDDALADLPAERPPAAPSHAKHGRHLYILRLDPDRLSISRDRFLAALHAENIGCGVHYVGVHLQPFYREHLGFRPEDFPVATRISETTVSLPLSAGMTDEDVEDVIRAVSRILRYYQR